MSIFDRLKTLGTPKVQEAEKDTGNSIASILRRNAEEDKKSYQEDAGAIDQFVRILCHQLTNDTSSFRSSDSSSDEPDNAFSRIYLTEDHMAAYACMFPPSENGTHISIESVIEDLRYDGICYGVEQRILSHMVQEQKYLHIFPIAKGTKPVDGEDGSIKSFYSDKDSFNLEAYEGKKPDFDEKNLIQQIRKGEVICRIKPATKGQKGRDVTGRVLKGYDGIGTECPCGKNTQISQDGELLTASVDGVVFMQDGKYCVDRKIVFQEDIKDASALEYDGDIFIRGSVSGGAVIKAGGDVIIEGMVHEAYITSGGTIRLQNGIRGEGKGCLKAEAQVQSRVIEDAIVEAGKDIYAESILNSNITTGGSIYVNTGRGGLAGGDIKALGSVFSKKIGNLSNCLTRITLGFFSDQEYDMRNLEKEERQLHEASERVKKDISALKALPQLSAGKRIVLARLIEQQSSYLERELKLNKELEAIKRIAQVQTRTDARVVSKEIYPTTEIRILGKEMVIQTLHTNCNIHLWDGQLVLY